MTDERWGDVTVATGIWRYDGAVNEAVRIVGLPYDYQFAMAEADGQLDVDEKPIPLGSDGFLYYVVFAQLDGGGFPTVVQAKGYAQSQVQSQIIWD